MPKELNRSKVKGQMGPDSPGHRPWGRLGAHQDTVLCRYLKTRFEQEIYSKIC